MPSWNLDLMCTVTLLLRFLASVAIPSVRIALMRLLHVYHVFTFWNWIYWAKIVSLTLRKETALLVAWGSCDCTIVRKVWLFNLDRHGRCLLGLWLSIFGDDLERPPFKFQVDYIQDSRRLWINRDLFSPSHFETTCRWWLCKGHALNLHISNWYWFKLTKKAIK